MAKSQVRNRDQDHLHWEPPTLQEPAVEAERPPVPTPRNRSFTCSDGKPQPPTPIAAHHSTNKKPVVPSRSEGAMLHGRPPLPTKSRPGMAEPPASKPRDYRDNLELPIKRLPARPGQSSAHRDGKGTTTSSLGIIFMLLSCTAYKIYSTSPGQPEIPKRSIQWRPVCSDGWHWPEFYMFGS